MSTQLLLRRLLEQRHLSGGERLLLVLDTGPEVVSSEEVTTAQGPYRVCRASTELALRHELWRARGERMVAFVEEKLALAMPEDLLLAARNQRVQVLTANEVLSAVLGAAVIGTDDPSLEALAMERLDDLRRLAERTFPSAVDAKLLGELLLEVSGESRVLRRSAAELLAEWIGEKPSWSAELQRLVQRTFLSRRGAEGSVLSWAVPEASRLSAIVVHGAVLSVDGKVPEAAWGPFWSAAEEIGLDRETLRQTLTDLAGAALERLGSSADSLLGQADALGRQSLVPEQLKTSTLLPLAFEAKADEMAKRLAAGDVLGPEAVEELRGYRSATRAEVEVIQEMARLSRWLAEPSSKIPPRSPQGDAASSDGVLEQVRHYQSHGAFADWAARRLLRARAKTRYFHAEVRDVLERYRTKRDAENRRFAETLQAGYEKALHADGVVALHQVTGELLSSGDATGSYVVLLDGCSYPVFLELLSELASDEDRPLGLLPDERDPVARGLPALAPLPSITSHARGAFFLGEVPHDQLIAETRFRDQDEPVTDKARFAKNQRLSGARTLLLKGDLTDGGEALFQALRDESIAVVAAVFNAVDDQIGSANTGAQVRVRLEQITALKGSLDLAVSSGRRVLVTADHGHTPFVDKKLRRGAKSPSRFVELSPGDEIPEGFLEIDLGGYGGFGGEHLREQHLREQHSRTAFAWRSGVYRGKQQAGFHGGCGLEELVVPLAWLGDRGLRADHPQWWGAFISRPEPEPLAVAEAPPVEEDVVEEEPGQIVLELVDVGSHGLPEEVWSLLDAGEQKVLDVLRENGAARSGEIARQLDKPPGRVPGLMSRLRRRLRDHPRFTTEILPDGEALFRYQEG